MNPTTHPIPGQLVLISTRVVMTDGYTEIHVMPMCQRMGVKDASQYMGLSEWTLRKWAYAGKVASIKLSTRLLFDKEELDRVLTENTRPAKAARGKR